MKLPIIPMEKQEDYTAVGAPLKTRFGSHHLQQIYINQLKSRIQHLLVNLQEYGDELKYDSTRMYPNNSRSS